MASYNKVILMGNLTRDPELRYTQGNMAICKVGLAVNRRYKDGQTGEWKEEPTFVDMTIFGKRGEAFQRFHKKGQTAFVEGHLRLDQWDDKTSGQKRSKLYVVVDDWQFTDSRSGAGGAGGGGDDRGNWGGSDGGYDEPAGGGGGGAYEPQSAGGYGGAKQQPPEYLEVDDTPF